MRDNLSGEMGRIKCHALKACRPHTPASAREDDIQKSSPPAEERRAERSASANGVLARSGGGGDRLRGAPLVQFLEPHAEPVGAETAAEPPPLASGGAARGEHQSGYQEGGGEGRGHRPCPGAREASHRVLQMLAFGNVPALRRHACEAQQGHRRQRRTSPREEGIERRRVAEASSPG